VPASDDLSTDVLVVRGLRKTFESGGAPVRALRHVDLAVARGEFVAVIGPSGCGKSTLLHIVAGLEAPTDGEVTIDGASLRGRGQSDLARMRRRHVGIVFQFFHLLERMTALENAILPAVAAGASQRDAERRARELLELAGVGDKAGEYPAQLSGGQRQRVAIARALASAPTLLLADEPTGALDSSGTAEILELLRRLHTDGQTIVLVTHDLGVAATADRRLEMRDGCLDDNRVVSPEANVV
jgi:putative ABC transport system ATP-binding protein